jgi:VWFA-related protein
MKQTREAVRQPYCTGMRFSLTAALAACTLGGFLLLAQDPSLIKVDVDIVSVLASVRDKRGGLVANLEKNDFTIFEDGKTQTIKYFSRETNLPLTIGLLVDVSGSQINLIETERSAASQFFQQYCVPKTSISDQLWIGSRITAGFHRKLSSAERRLEPPAAGHGGRRPSPGSVPTISKQRGTVLFDAIYLAAAEKLKSEVGRKVSW